MCKQAAALERSAHLKVLRDTVPRLELIFFHPPFNKAEFDRGFYHAGRKIS
jgi:hypothetical protein